ncbi:Ankyrin repeat and FYVE domain-containing protein 1 [Desmophyllum pertusum]|uniref:Ankyrin repeat and FYVE domain-containing protein 1 n=1 Tax=Desmophyllum pertusum TaxID=174260 RepID=A0A9W9Z5D9_9CNID|nr:Ankyrin repeat and FYVE domain-containing protein 1 [Desmophyllum pertusum]
MSQDTVSKCLPDCRKIFGAKDYDQSNYCAEIIGSGKLGSFQITGLVLMSSYPVSLTSWSLPSGQVPLHILTHRKQESIAKTLVGVTAVYVNMADFDGKCLLHKGHHARR